MKTGVRLCALASLVAFCGWMGYGLFHPYVRARSLLSQVSALQVGRSSFEEAKQVGQRLGSQGNDPCSALDCYWTFVVDNFKVPELWRGEGVRFIAGFRVQDSVVSEQRFMFQIGTGFNAQTADFWERGSWPRFPKQFIVGTQTSPSFPHFRSYVNLTPATPADLRSRYLSFDLSCFWKYHGCRDAEELLPTVNWEQK